MRPFCALGRCDDVLLFFDTETCDLSFVLTVYLLLVVGLLIHHHFVADHVKNDRTLEGQQRSLDRAELDSVYPVEVGIRG